MATYAAENLRLVATPAGIRATWTFQSAPAGVISYLWVDGKFYGGRLARQADLAGGAVHSIYIIGADSSEPITSASDGASTPPVRPVLNWVRPSDAGVARYDIARWNVYAGNTSGGAVDTSAPVATIPVYAREWSWKYVGDALAHGSVRKFRVVPVTLTGREDVDAGIDVTWNTFCISRALEVTALDYDPIGHTAEFTLA